MLISIQCMTSAAIGYPASLQATTVKTNVFNLYAYLNKNVPILISKVTGPSVQATIVASRKQANNLYLRRRRYVCEETNEGSNSFSVQP